MMCVLCGVVRCVDGCAEHKVIIRNRILSTVYPKYIAAGVLGVVSMHYSDSCGNVFDYTTSISVACQLASDLDKDPTGELVCSGAGVSFSVEYVHVARWYFRIGIVIVLCFAVQ